MSHKPIETGSSAELSCAIVAVLPTHDTRATSGVDAAIAFGGANERSSIATAGAFVNVGSCRVVDSIAFSFTAGPFPVYQLTGPARAADDAERIGSFPQIAADASCSESGTSTIVPSIEVKFATAVQPINGNTAALAEAFASSVSRSPFESVGIAAA